MRMLHIGKNMGGIDIWEREIFEGWGWDSLDDKMLSVENVNGWDIWKWEIFENAIF